MPTKIQYFFAKNWPLKIGCIIGVLAGMVKLAYHLFDTRFWTNPYTLIFSVSLILLAGILGFFMSLIFLSFILQPIYYLGARLNGAPFCVSDEVQIIVGPYQGKSAKIYEIWSERKQVRVYLGEEEKEAAKDVFSYTEIFKIKKGGI